MITLGGKNIIFKTTNDTSLDQ